MRFGKLLGVRARALLALPLLLGCSAATASRPRAPEYPDLPPFFGQETERWLVEDSGPVGRDDVLPAFEDSAKDYGCRTEKLGNKITPNIYGQTRRYYGVTASCYEGTISLIAFVGGNIRIGCAKPTTIQACEQLLRDISESR